MALPLLTQPQLVEEVAYETGFSKADTKIFLTALGDVVNANVVNCNRVKLAGVIIEPALRKATKKRMGRNPQTGEEVEVAAKPASVRIKVTATKPLKDAAPTVQKLRRNLA
jgi:DNA-binding protein HU-beta